jgi:hypothetical protein
MKKYSNLVAYIDDICKDQDRAEKIKKTKQRKRIEEYIAVAILQGDPKRAIDIAERYNIPPQEFGKMVAKYSRFAL